MLPTGKVLYYPHPLLSMPATTVGRDVSIDALKRMSDDMFETMRKLGGVGLAGPQVGVQLRIFVMDCGPWGENGPMVFINPMFQPMSEIPASDGTADDLDRLLGARDATPGSRLVEVEEGCLSFPGTREKQVRYDKVLCHFLDLESWEAGLASSTQVFTGMEAQCIQHETEHLDGVTLASRWGAVKKDQAKRRINKIVRARR